MIRVAFPFVGDTIGGSHISASQLMAGLPAHGFAPVAVVHSDGPLAGWLESRGLAVIRVDLPFLSSEAAGISALLRIGMMALPLTRFLRKERFALVAANDGRMVASWMLPARLAGISAVAHRRTVWRPSRLAHLSLRLAHGIIAISDYIRRSLPADLRVRATIVANPFDSTPPRREQARNAVQSLIGFNGPVIAFIGTLQPQKRPEVFLQAAALVHRALPNVGFVMMGRENGLGASLRRRCAELGLADVVVMAGFRIDAPFLLAGCDLLVAPAIEEGHGRALVEAMLAGVPVVAAASGGHREIILDDKTGLLVTPDDASAFAAAALRLLADADAAQAMSDAAGRWARVTFSQEEHAKTVAAFYRNLLTNR